MYGFILTGHGHFSNGLKSAIDMVAGEVPAFQIVPFEGENAGGYGDDLRAAVTAMCEECPEGVLVFVDLLGGTPFNQAMMISAGADNIRVVAGTNLPMLIELIMTRGMAASLDALADQAVAVGQAGVVTKKLEPMEDDEDDEM